MGKGREGGPCASSGYTPIFWGLSAAAGVAFVFLIVGHALAGDVEDSREPGELPLWYQIEACQNTTGTITTTPTGEVTLCANEASSCPTSWNMHVARKAPEAVTETETACPAVVDEQEELRIALEPDDGFLEGAPYNPVVVLPTGASALISFKIEDGEGGTLLPTTNAELGPGTTYPWRELNQSRGVILLPPSPLPPSAPSLRRLVATEADPHAPASLIQQEALRGVQVEDAAEAAAERDVVPAPGSRRLLKGGSSGGGGFGSSSSSRGFSRSGRTSAYSSGYSRSSSRTSYSTSSYKSYQRGGHYTNSYGGSYYGGGRPYGYHYGYGGYGTSTSIYIVRPYYYGCYSCGRRTCNSCGNCKTRRECKGEEAYTTAAKMDRYEFIDSKFKMQKARWPAFLVIHNATIFTSTPGAASAYVTFFRDGYEPEAGAGGTILTLAYIAFACILLTCCWFQQQGKLKLRPEQVYGGQLHTGWQPQVAQPQFAQPQVAQPQMMIQAAGGYPQAVGGYPQAVGGMMPVAQPAPSAMAMATAYPQAVQPTMPGYPQAVPMAQSGYPQAQAYPSAPASPPASPDSPSEPVVEKKDE